jgi:hypothetical protein
VATTGPDVCPSRWNARAARLARPPVMTIFTSSPPQETLPILGGGTAGVESPEDRAIARDRSANVQQRLWKDSKNQATPRPGTFMTNSPAAAGQQPGGPAIIRHDVNVFRSSEFSEPPRRGGPLWSDANANAVVSRGSRTGSGDCRARIRRHKGGWSPGGGALAGSTQADSITVNVHQKSRHRAP